LAGIYIHIPFCKRKCHYCNFFSLASSKNRNEFVDAILKEISREQFYLGSLPVQTIYFGGGTPSLLKPSEIQKILDTVTKFFSVSGSPEITLEANPDDLDPEFLKALYSLGINRLSIGIQSFFDEDLVFLNRIHSAETAKRSILDAWNTGFQNLSIDLIYGIPGQVASTWDQNLETAFALKIPHISAYALTIEDKTILDLFIRRHKIPSPDEKSAIDQYRLLMQKMKEQNYIHYEISNFCKENFYSKHNSNYWKSIPYLGLGPSAHSFNGTSRKWNVSNLTTFIENIRSGIPTYEEEDLTVFQRFNEYIMTSLRTNWGCNPQKIIDDFGITFYDSFKKSVLPSISKGLMKEVAGNFILTDEGKLFADAIASDLFIIEPDNGSKGKGFSRSVFKA